MAVAAEAQIVVSRFQEISFMPMPEIIMDTGGLPLGVRVAWTAGGERISPGVMERLVESMVSGMPLARREEINFEGVRATGGGVRVWRIERGKRRRG